MTTTSYAKLLYDKLAAHRNPESVAPMREYLHNEFDFFGINTPARRVLLDEHIGEHGLPTLSSLEKNVRLLWKLPERECQYCAEELLEKRVNELTLEQIPLLEFMITHKARWDTVDFIATKLVGPLLQNQVAAAKWKTGEWIDSGNIWLTRTAILFQLKYKEHTDTELLTSAINYAAASDQFSIRKAIGWALREYAKTDPKWVSGFVDRTHLSSLSRREALKHFPND